MISELTRLKDCIAFIAFVKQNFNGDNYKFLNGYQKFLMLIENYKEAENEAFFLYEKRNFLNGLQITAAEIVDYIYTRAKLYKAGNSNTTLCFSPYSTEFYAKYIEYVPYDLYTTGLITIATNDRFKSELVKKIYEFNKEKLLTEYRAEVQKKQERPTLTYNFQGFKKADFKNLIEDKK
jgi:hypothetical protein